MGFRVQLEMMQIPKDIVHEGLPDKLLLLLLMLPKVTQDKREHRAMAIELSLAVWNVHPLNCSLYTSQEQMHKNNESLNLTTRWDLRSPAPIPTLSVSF